jgi:hypothetical protein
MRTEIGLRRKLGPQLVYDGDAQIISQTTQSHLGPDQIDAEREIKVAKIGRIPAIRDQSVLDTRLTR